jgi:RAD51-like protein 2
MGNIRFLSPQKQNRSSEQGVHFRPRASLTQPAGTSVPEKHSTYPMAADLLLDSFPIRETVLERLHESGFRTSSDLQNISPTYLARECSISLKDAAEVISVVIGEQNSTTYTTALDALRSKKDLPPIITMCREVDVLLGGGFPCGQATELCGTPGIGKSQFAMQLAVNTRIPRCFGGVAGSCIYIDTEGSFMVERVAEIAEGTRSTLKKITQSHHGELVDKIPTLHTFLDGITLYRVHSVAELMSLLYLLADGSLMLHADPLRLFVIDSIAFPFRQGQETDMGQRTRLLMTAHSLLQRVCHQTGCATLVLNQVVHQEKERDNSNGNSDSTIANFKPSLGESWGHACSQRLILCWHQGCRHACLTKAPSLPSGIAPFAITSQGIRTPLFSTSSSSIAVDGRRIAEQVPDGKARNQYPSQDQAGHQIHHSKRPRLGE